MYICTQVYKQNESLWTHLKETENLLQEQIDKAQKKLSDLRELKALSSSEDIENIMQRKMGDVKSELDSIKMHFTELTEEVN